MRIFISVSNILAVYVCDQYILTIDLHQTHRTFSVIYNNKSEIGIISFQVICAGTFCSVSKRINTVFSGFPAFGEHFIKSCCDDFIYLL